MDKVMPSDILNMVHGVIENNKLSFDISELNLESEQTGYVVISNDEAYLVINKTRPTEFKVVKRNEVISSKEVTLSNISFIGKLNKDKASYRKDENVVLTFNVKNTVEDSPMVVKVDLYKVNTLVATVFEDTKLYLRKNENKDYSVTIPADLLENNTGYLVSIRVEDVNGHIDIVNTAVSVEENWTVFPRYGIVGGSGDDYNSILLKNKQRYEDALGVMTNMNINSYFFYDAYKSPQNPFPLDKPQFSQDWNTWSHSKVDVEMITDMTKYMHSKGSVAMLYNMCFARSIDEPETVSAIEYAYNHDTYGLNKKGTPYINYIDGKPFQYYYHPMSKQWRDHISKVMIEAMKNGGFDGWQGDTIGDRTINAYYDADSKEHYMSDYYGDFIADMKKRMPDKYVTINDVNGEHIDKMLQSNQDVVYNEIWPFGQSALVIDGQYRSQTEYGDLKARVDDVRRKTGKSLIVGAYIQGPDTEWKDGKRVAKNGSGEDSIADKTYNLPAVLLTTATISAAGGYHMSSAVLANRMNDDGLGIGILEKDYYPTQSLRTTKEITRKVSDYNQFVTAYENILRGTSLEDSTNEVEVFNEYNFKQNWDKYGTRGFQIWAWTKQGKGFRTIQMINLSDVVSNWKNEAGTKENKQPTFQNNLTVKYTVGTDKDLANKLANNVFVVSPDDWSKSTMIKCQATVELVNKKYVLNIKIPKLDIWNTIYIAE